MANHIGKYEDKALIQLNGKPVIILGGDKDSVKGIWYCGIIFVHKAQCFKMDYMCLPLFCENQ